MQKSAFWAVLVVLTSTVSCSTFQPVKPVVSQVNLPNECEQLISLVQENWKKHKKLNYYKGEKDFLTIIQRDYRKCITSLTKKEIIAVLGQPVKDDSDFVYYFLGESCLHPMRENCEALIFYLNEDSGKVNEYLVHPFGVLEEKK
jgi:hypothetical protein